MFKKNNRYVTRGVSEEVDIRLQLIMWSMIDKLKDKGNIEVDYLQIFKIRKEGNKIVINQSQEVPEYSFTHEIEVEDIRMDYVIKLYVIDSEEYSTMLFPYEYQQLQEKRYESKLSKKNSKLKVKNLNLMKNLS